MTRTLLTPRLRLRPFRAGDWPDVVAYHTSSPLTWRYDPGHRPTKGELRRRLRLRIRQASGPAGRLGILTRAIEIRGCRRVAGYVGLQPCIIPGGVDPPQAGAGASNEVELFYKLGRRWWGRGLAEEACRAVLAHALGDIGLRRIFVCIDGRNQRSLRLAVRLGFRLHPVAFANGFWAAGEWCGVLTGCGPAVRPARRPSAPAVETVVGRAAELAHERA